MKPFSKINSIITPFDKANVDTDQIIPKQFLKLITKSGFGKFLFYDWRFNHDGKEKADFILNDLHYQNSQILVTNLVQNLRNGEVFIVYLKITQAGFQYKLMLMH